MSKRCNKCKVVKPLTDYQRDASRPDGFSYCCGECEQARKRAAYDPAAAKSRSRQYRTRNREKDAARVIEYERRRVAKDRYYKILAGGRFRARRRGLPADLFHGPDLLAYWGQVGIDPDRCWYCKRVSPDELDHVIPLTHINGAHQLDRLVPACSFCNNQKHGKTPTEYLTWLASTSVHDQDRSETRAADMLAKLGTRTAT